MGMLNIAPRITGARSGARYLRGVEGAGVDADLLRRHTDRGIPVTVLLDTVGHIAGGKAY